MEIFGGSGYNRGERVELLWRDARAGSLMRPADEVAQIMLGRLECGLDPV
jgi:alkylation response protein AidB-like acyl-CoA dehydrogenase